MTAVTLGGEHISAMSDAAVARVRALESALLEQPQLDIEITHELHAGLYARTARLPAGCLCTGVLVLVPTVLVVVGDVDVFTEEGCVMHLRGHNVVTASSGRKQAWLAHTETFLTMAFATQAKTVAEAEAEFTSEAALLTTSRSR